jgi:hypothetical protein
MYKLSKLLKITSFLKHLSTINLNLFILIITSKTLFFFEIS